MTFETTEKTLYLLQERYEHASAPFIRLRQINVFEVQNQPLCILRSIHTSFIGADHLNMHNAYQD